jgi:hypothetical protein
VDAPAEMELKRAIMQLSTCGQTTERLTEEICGRPNWRTKVTPDCYGQSDAKQAYYVGCDGGCTCEDLRTKLNGAFTNYTLLEVDLSTVVGASLLHEFMIDINTDQSKIMTQGYLGGFTAYWWVGIAAASDPTKDLAALRLSRTTFASPIPAANWTQLVDGLYNLCSYNVWNGSAELQAIWQTLPFFPSDKDKLKLDNGEALVAINIKEWHVKPERLDAKRTGLKCKLDDNPNFLSPGVVKKIWEVGHSDTYKDATKPIWPVYLETDATIFTSPKTCRRRR